MDFGLLRSLIVPHAAEHMLLCVSSHASTPPVSFHYLTVLIFPHLHFSFARSNLFFFTVYDLLVSFPLSHFNPPSLSPSLSAPQ